MKSDQVANIFLFMQDFALRAGNIALARQAGVKNVGKEVRGPILAKDSQGGSAKTVVDEIIQELFLAELYVRFPNVRVNVEEDTPLVPLFPLHAKITVHLDPLDGTLPYAQQNKTFTVGMAISDAQNNFTHSVIYAPALDRIYAACPEGWITCNGRGASIPEAASPNTSLIKEKRVLSSKGRQAFELLGFHVEGIPSPHLAIIDVVCGTAAAFLYGLSNPHDSFIPYAFARAKGMRPTDVRGIPLEASSLRVTFEDERLRFERIPSVCYVAKDTGVQKAVREILSNPENLNAGYEVLSSRRAHEI